MTRRLGAAALLGLAAAAAPAFADGEDEAAAGKVPPAVRGAVRDYLRAEPAKEKAALAKALAALHGDLEVAVAALRSHDRLEPAAKPGTRHGLTFPSGGGTWEYSIRLPAGYDGRKRFPVLVLPDHATVSAEDGIGFWEGKEGVEDYVLFRPVVLKHREDRSRFPEAPFLVRDAPIARVVADGLAALRLRYAVDPDRIAMTGLSQAGFYTWYLAVSYPDQFAAIVPESAGGTAQRALVQNVAVNLVGPAVRILHAEGDAVCPYGDAVAMRDALQKAGGRVELITYRDADYAGAPFPNRHPGPHHLRLRNVLPWAKEQRRTFPDRFTRVLRYPQQGFEGRFRLDPPKDPTKPVTATFSSADGALSCDVPGAVYRVSPEDVLAGRSFRVGSKEVRPKADLRLLLTSYKETGDVGRLVAAEIRLGP